MEAWIPPPYVNYGGGLLYPDEYGWGMGKVYEFLMNVVW